MQSRFFEKRCRIKTLYHCLNKLLSVEKDKTNFCLNFTCFKINVNIKSLIFTLN